MSRLDPLALGRKPMWVNFEENMLLLEMVDLKVEKLYKFPFQRF